MKIDITIFDFCVKILGLHTLLVFDGLSTFLCCDYRSFMFSQYWEGFE